MNSTQCGSGSGSRVSIALKVKFVNFLIFFSNCCLFKHFNIDGSGDTAFFNNSIWLKCFWFGLEILRLVYKKHFWKYWIVSILFDHLSSRKVPLSLIIVENSIQKIVCKGYQKNRNYALISKRCKTQVLGKRAQKFYRKTDFLCTCLKSARPKEMRIHADPNPDPYQNTVSPPPPPHGLKKTA